MKTLVKYKSRTGFTKRYAEWIAERLSADIFEASKAGVEVFKAYDTVIYGGGLYAAGINGVKLITGNLEKLKGKKVVVFATGASPAREDAIREVRNTNFTPDGLKQIQFFYFRGGFDFSKLNLFYKVLMTLFKWKLRMKKVQTADERGMLSAYDKPADFTRKQNIEALIAAVNS